MCIWECVFVCGWVVNADVCFVGNVWVAVYGGGGDSCVCVCCNVCVAEVTSCVCVYLGNACGGRGLWVIRLCGFTN